MERLLMYVDSSDATVLVLEHTGEKLENIVGDCGSDLSDWPMDLGAYKESTGLHIWEGEISDNYKFDGKIRHLNDKEWRQVRNNQRVVSGEIF